MIATREITAQGLVFYQATCRIMPSTAERQTQHNNSQLACGSRFGNRGELCDIVAVASAVVDETIAAAVIANQVIVKPTTNDFLT
jgi:hypothetical protein